MTPVDLLVLLEGALELDPALLAARLVAADDRFAERVLDALQIDLDLGADLDGLVAAGAGEFLEGDAAFGLQTDIDDGDVLLDGDDDAADDGALVGIRTAEGTSRSAAKSSRDGARLADWTADIHSPGDALKGNVGAGGLHCGPPPSSAPLAEPGTAAPGNGAGRRIEPMAEGVGQPWNKRPRLDLIEYASGTGRCSRKAEKGAGSAPSSRAT